MPVQSLFDLAKAKLIQNINMLTDIGDLPYDFIAPVLKHVQNPSQLLEIEANCPQIVGETGEIWLRFIKRDIPDWEKKRHQPSNPKSWSKVYKKLKQDAELEKEKQEQALREQMKALQEQRAGNQTQIVEGRTGYNPAARRRAPGSSGWNWGSSGAPAKTGKVAFDKLRRGMFDQKQARPRAAQIPAHLLAQRRGQIKNAPERLIRMQEAEQPQKLVIPKRLSATLAAKPGSQSSNIRSGPMRQANTPAPEKPQRASLPAGQHFSAPKLQPQGSAGAAVKRKKEEVDLFLKPKRRKV